MGTVFRKAILLAFAFSTARALTVPNLTITSTTVPANIPTQITAAMIGQGGCSSNGTVTFREGGTTLGTATLAFGFWTITATLSPGTHIVTASFSGDSLCSAVQSPATPISAIATSVTLTSLAPPGFITMVTATVVGAQTICPGSVTFTEGTKTIATLPLSNGSATLQAWGNPLLPDGPHTLVASYPSSGSCSPGVSDPFPVYVGVPTSVTEIVSITPNPIPAGQTGQVTVRVTPAAGTATGTVFLAGGPNNLQIASGTLDASSTARVTLALPLGSWNITAQYAGSASTKASNSAPAAVVVAPSLVVTSAAGGLTTIAPDSLATAWGLGLSTVAVSATLPLPTALSGLQLNVPDSSGASQKAPLLFASATQLNFLVPSQAQLGAIPLTLTNAQRGWFGIATIDSVAPAIFTADGTANGAPIAILVTAHADGSQESNPAYQCDTSGCRTAPLDVSRSGDTNVLVIYATGIRHASLDGVSATIGSTKASVVFAGAQSQYPGLDQINVALPASLAGAGEVTMAIVAQGRAANPVRLQFR